MSKNVKISRKRFVKLYASRHPHMRAAKDAADALVAVRYVVERANRDCGRGYNTQRPLWKSMWELEEDAE